MSPIGLAIRPAGPVISFEIRTHRATDETVQADLRALPGRRSKLTRAATSPARASPSGCVPPRGALPAAHTSARWRRPRGHDQGRSTRRWASSVREWTPSFA